MPVRPSWPGSRPGIATTCSSNAPAAPLLATLPASAQTAASVVAGSANISKLAGGAFTATTTTAPPRPPRGAATQSSPKGRGGAATAVSLPPRAHLLAPTAAVEAAEAAVSARAQPSAAATRSSRMHTCRGLGAVAGSNRPPPSTLSPASTSLSAMSLKGGPPSRYQAAVHGAPSLGFA